MRGLGYTGFGFSMASVAAFVIIIVLIFTNLMPSKLFYTGLLAVCFISALVGFLFCLLQLIVKDYPFVMPTMILNLIFMVISVLLFII